MKIIRPLETVPRERAAAIEPAPAVRIADDVLRRLNHYPGRTLTRTGLDVEATHRLRHLGLTGMERSAGVVAGLEVGVEPMEEPASGDRRDETSVLPWDGEADRTPRGRCRLTISPGRGLCANGEDVVLARPLRVPLDAIPHDETATGEPSGPPRGVGFVILQPICGETPGDPDEMDPCEMDPGEEAYRDYRRVDGCRVVWMPWPSALGRLPAPGPRFRNILAYRIFTYETASSGADPVFPWEKTGLPLALMQVATDGTVVFVDRWSVVRRGGAPRPKTPLFPGRGTVFLWQARMEQLHEHLRDLFASGTTPEVAADRFRYLPPVGVLPKDVLDTSTHRSRFFPGAYRLEAAPIPLEQLEWVVEAAASLKPVDLDAPDGLILYVPVPQEFYDPKLLLKEHADPTLPETIDTLLQEIGLLLGRQADLRDQASVVVGSIRKAAVPAYPDPDPDAQPGEIAFTENALRNVYRKKTLDRLTALADQTLKPYSLTPSEKQALDRLQTGSVNDPEYLDLTAFIEDLDDKIRRSNDAVDLGFLKVQTDIYRMRQILLGDEKATRLATSPVLADIAKGESSYATEQHLRTFFERAKASEPMEPAPRSATATASAGAVRTATVSFAASAATSRRALDFAGEQIPVVAEASREDVLLKNPIVGTVPDFRSTTVAERIADPLAPEAKNYAVATKADIVHRIQDIPIQLADVPAPVSDGATAVLNRDDFENFRKKYPNAVEQLKQRIETQGAYVLVRLKGLTAREQESLGEALPYLLAHRTVRLNDPNLPLLILSGAFDPDPDTFDEPAFLAAGVTALETAVGILRRIEGRILDYRTVREKCAQCLKSLEEIALEWSTTLKGIDNALAEKRHDLVTARWLLEEENARVTGINRRRLDILQNHVPFVVYARPRRASITLDGTPRLKLRGLWSAPVPACLRRDQDAPEDLEAMFRHLRSMPLAWFPELKKLLDQLQRPEKITEIFTAAKAFAAVLSRETASGDRASSLEKTAGFVIGASAAKQVVAAYEKTADARRRITADLDLKVLEELSWKNLKEEGERTLSVNDLLRGSSSRSRTVRAAVQHLEAMENVATCFSVQTGRVPPSIRLLWAQKISQFDAPVDLRRLSVLPRWGDLSLELRRDLQSLGDWLFAQVNPSEAEAVAFMNDVVRVAVLTASHAPVDQIVSGHAPAPAAGRIGDRLSLVVDKGLVRIGMQVSLEAGAGATVRGIVEDMSGPEVRVRVTDSDTASFTIAAGAKARFL